MAKLIPKQEMFCREYMIDLNATQAAIRAGYSEKTANREGSRLLSNVDIQSRIAELMQERVEKVGADAAYVLRRLIEIDQMDALDILDDSGVIKPISQWPKVWRQYLSGFDIAEIKLGDKEDAEACIKKIKWPDKVKNLELLGKHVNVQAFSDKSELTGNINIQNTIKATELTDDQLAAIASGKP